MVTPSIKGVRSRNDLRARLDHFLHYSQETGIYAGARGTVNLEFFLMSRVGGELRLTRSIRGNNSVALTFTTISRRIMNTRAKSLRTIIIVSLAALTMSSGIATATAAPNNKPKVLELYVENRGLAKVDSNEPGIDHGDLFHRELAIAKSINGPMIGVSYSQGEVISHNPEKNVDVRRVIIQNVLPKGKMFFMGVTEIDRGSVPSAGWTDNYAIIGGTGIYAGSRGTLELVLLADGKTYKSTATYTLN
jgi:hypothetical protein